MTRRTAVQVIRSLLLLAVLASLGAPGVARAQGCGPGPGWVDACPEGMDTFLARATDVVIDLGPSGGGVVRAPDMYGRATALRSGGDPTTSSIFTELVSLFLRGGGLTLRAGDGIADGMCLGPDALLCSPGLIQATTPTLATAYFALSFEISGAGAFGPVHASNVHPNEVPCYVQATIDRLPPPPGTEYVCPSSSLPIPLFDGDEVLRGLVTSMTIEVITPEPTGPLLTGTGLLLIAAWGARRRRTGVPSSRTRGRESGAA